MPQRFVLLGDIHVYRRMAWPWQVMNKRLLGLMNLWLRRQFRFKQQLLPSLFEHAASQEPDHWLFTGDLTTTALDAEFDDAMALINRYVGDSPAFIVPGNHDRYTFQADRSRAFERHVGDRTASVWPCYRELSPGFHLIGLDPTHANFLFAHGVVGERQRAAMASLVRDRTGPDDQLVVVCHYPLGTPPSRPEEELSHGLQDIPEVVELLADLGRPTIYLHGHVHYPWCWRLPAAENVVAINVGAPVMRKNKFPYGEGYWLMERDEHVDAAGSLSNIRVKHIYFDGAAWITREVSVPRAAGEESLIK